MVVLLAFPLAFFVCVKVYAGIHRFLCFVLSSFPQLAPLLIVCQAKNILFFAGVLIPAKSLKHRGAGLWKIPLPSKSREISI